MSAHRLSALIALSLSLFCTAAHSATISLTPGNQTVGIGDNVALQLTMDFTGDPTVGGGIDVFFDDTVLQYVSFVFDAGFGDDPDFRLLPNVLPNQLESLAFGNFAGLSGSAVVGTLVFTALSEGSVNITLAENETIAGGFYSALTDAHQTVIFNGATVSVAAVPLPAAGWLLVSGAIGLLGFRRTRV